MKHLRTPCYMPDYDGGVGTGDSGIGTSGTPGQGNASNTGPAGGYDNSFQPGMEVDVSLNPDGSIDINIDNIGLFGDNTISISPYGDVNRGGFLDSISYDLGFRSSFTDSVDLDGNLTKNFDPVGFGNATVDVTMADKTGYGTNNLSGGTIASYGIGFGLTGIQAITVEAVTKASIDIALGQPIAAIAPTAKALEAQGVIDAKTSHTIQAAGALASFAKGMINGFQALDAINTAKNYGAINNLEAAIMAGVTIHSMYSGFQGVQSKIESLGFIATHSDLIDFGITSDGDNSYIRGTEITVENVGKHITSFSLYMESKNTSSFKKDIFEKMAGSVFYNNFAAGGDIFNPAINPLVNHTAAIGKDIRHSLFVQMSYLQNDFVGTSLNPYNIVNDYES